MGNMSYCRFENTFRDLYQCSVVLGELFESGAELSESEEKYKRQLLELCRELVDDYGDDDRRHGG